MTMARIALMIVDRDVAPEASAETRFGGAPSVDGDFTWPRCRLCTGNMQFLGQIREEQRLHLAFMCQNRPGVCWEWDADRGGTAVTCVGIDDLRLADLPPDGDVSRPTLYGARIEHIEAEHYDAARDAWAGGPGRRGRDVLGQLGGTPRWLDADETPPCDHCREPMRFVAQLEEGPDHDTAMNFAGGCGYLFRCECAGGSGKFLWQG